MTATTSTEMLVYGYIAHIEQSIIVHRKMEEEIKAICLNYFGYIFDDSTIIDIIDAIKLQNLLSDRISFDDTLLLYNSKMNGTDINSFYDQTESHDPTVLIIKSNHGNIFGAFTKIPWNKGGHYQTDVDAALFVLKSDQNDESYQLFDVCQEEKAINFGSLNRYSRLNIVCHFGSPAGLCLYHNFDQIDTNFCFGGDTCSYWVPKGNILCGGNNQDNKFKEKYKFKVIHLEVFKLL